MKWNPKPKNYHKQKTSWCFYGNEKNKYRLRRTRLLLIFWKSNCTPEGVYKNGKAVYFGYESLLKDIIAYLEIKDE